MNVTWSYFEWKWVLCLNLIDSEAAAPAMAGGGGLRGALMDGLAWGVGTSVASRMMAQGSGSQAHVMLMDSK